MEVVNFLEKYQKSTKRDYLARMTEHDKAECAKVAKQWGYDYWDGDRRYGYGGYRYDGRWLPIAQEIAAHYGLKPGDRILDIGCGKAFLLYEFTQAVPGVEVTGVDVSEYGIEHAKPEIKDALQLAGAESLPFADDSFDFVYSINVFHNLTASALKSAFGEIERVSKGKAWLCVESYRTEAEKVNLLCWQLTCESFHRPDDWRFLAQEWGYSGDLGFIYFD